MLSVSVYTFGCKLNQLESEALADAFRRAGFSVAALEESSRECAAPPDLIIINTCTVTSRSDQKARRVIRKALRDFPFSCVIVTGCYAALDGEKIAALEEGRAAEQRLFVFGDKAALLELPVYLASALNDTAARAGRTAALVARWLMPEETKTARGGEGAFRFTPEKFSFHTRAFLKIQDGCDNHCTYCRIRLARGPSVSMAAAQALEELRALEAAGYWEAVLTGVNITQYRNSPDDTGGLGGLLRVLLEGTRTIGIRLSSLEPLAITDEFAEVLAHPRIRPHFHLSAQSGSKTVLGKMGRAYSGAAVEKAAGLLRSVKGNPFLACDIITGFPGEGEAEFEETLAMCRNTGFAWIHAFPYSKRPGTAAYAYAQTVSEEEAMRRVDILTKLAWDGRRNYARSWVGGVLETLVESGGGKSPLARDSGEDQEYGAADAELSCEYCRGLSDNYLRVLIRCSGKPVPSPGTVLKCEARALSERAGYDVYVEI